MECSSFVHSLERSRTVYREIKRITGYPDINEFTNLLAAGD